MKLRVHERADAEIGHELDYYHSRDPALADALEAELRAALASIAQFPYAARRWRNRDDVRVALLEQFPFTLPYLIFGDELVVLAFAHTSRRPGYWTRRR